LAAAPAGGEETKEEMLLTDGMDQRKSALDRREEELRNLEIILKKRWAKIQIEAKKLSEERSRSQLGAFGGTMPAPTTQAATVPATAATTAPTPAAGDVEMRPLLRVRCIGCKKPIPIYSSKRPLKVECKNCGKVGILR